MKSLQRRASVISAIALVLLLYLLATGLSELLVRSGFPAQWRQSASSVVLCVAGMVLVATHANFVQLGERGHILAAASVGLALSALFQVVQIFALMAYLDSHSGFEYDHFPPLQQIAIELLFGAVSEELIFSVFLYSIFKQRMRVGLAVALVTFAFAAMHRPGSMVSVLGHVMYIVSALALFEKYRSVTINIAFHLTANALLFASVLRLADSPLLYSPISGHAGVIAGCLFAVQLFWALRLGWFGRSAGTEGSDSTPGSSVLPATETTRAV